MTPLLFGSPLKGELVVDFQDETNTPIAFILDGPEGSLTLNGTVQSGVLFLNAPLMGRFEASSSFVKYGLGKDITAILASQDNPISFRIESKGFVLPLSSFGIEKIAIGLASIDLGKLYFQNDDKLGKTLSLLRLGKNVYLSAFFTPLYFHVHNGVLQIERVDLLLQGSYPFAAWGNVDLVRQKLDMQIGVSGFVLARAFNVPIKDPHSYISIPLQGTLQHPRLDKSSATAQITNLAMESQAISTKGVVGAVIRLASVASNHSVESIPPPTTNPLPWEDSLQIVQRENNNIPIAEPIKVISEGASKLLKNIFSN